MMPGNSPVAQQSPLQSTPATGKTQKPAAKTDSTPSATLLPLTPAQREMHELKIRHNIVHKEVTLAIRIVLVLCFASLASLSLVPALLSPPKATPPSQPTATYSDGACTAQPGDGGAGSYPGATNQRPTVPTNWSNAGRNEEDLMLVQACAAAFARNYETFDATDLTSLTSAITMLSATAKKRFYQGVGITRANQREDPQWQAQARSAQLKQDATVSSAPTLQAVSSQNTTLFATLKVQLTVTTTKNTTASSTTKKELNVTLATVKPDPNTKSTGWQVTDWVEQGS